MPLSAKILFSQVYTGLPLIPVMPPFLTAFLLFFRLFLPLNGGHRFGYALRPIGPAQPVIPQATGTRLSLLRASVICW